MNDKNKVAPPAPATIEELTAQVQALAEENARLTESLQFEIESRQALTDQVRAMQESVTEVATSLDINPAPPPPLERPLVEIDGAQYRFKAAAFLADGKRILASDVAANPDTLAEVFGKYPGLFERIGD